MDIGENFSTLNIYSNGYSYKIYCYGEKDNKEDVRLNNEVELMNKLLEIKEPVSAIDLYKLVKECVQDLSNLSKFRIVINEQKSKKAVGELEIIDNNTLVAITLLIAQSNPKEKNIMIDLIMNFICSV